MSPLIRVGLGISGLVCLSGCVTSSFNIVYTKPCSSVVSKEDRKDTPGAPIPLTDGDGSWFTFGDKQTGQLDLANKRGEANITTIERCEEHDRSAILVPKGKFIGTFIKKK